MKKVLCERPRRGGRYNYHDFRPRKSNRDFEDLPSHEGMRRPYGWDAKDFSDLLGPLQRYLRRSVGRPYDEVWSEICAHVPADTTTGAHLRDHAKWECETNTEVVDGKVVTRGSSRWSRSPAEPWGLYVDPRDGLIYYNERPNRRPKPRVTVDGVSYTLGDNGTLEPVVSNYRLSRGSFGVDRAATHGYPIKLIDGQKAMKIDGVWYWVTVMEIDPMPVPGPDGRPFLPSYRDVVYEIAVNKGRYHAAKRQMSSRDLRRHGLAND